MRGLHGHIKFGPSDPIEMVNNLLQRKVQKYDSGMKDSFGRTTWGREQAPKALSWAIAECRVDGTLKATVQAAVRARARRLAGSGVASKGSSLSRAGAGAVRRR